MSILLLLPQHHGKAVGKYRGENHEEQVVVNVGACGLFQKIIASCLSQGCQYVHTQKKDSKTFLAGGTLLIEHTPNTETTLT